MGPGSSGPRNLLYRVGNLFGIGSAHKIQRMLIHGGTTGIGKTALMLCREIGIRRRQ